VPKRLAPKKKLRGLAAPLHIVDAADQILGLENEAYVVMGGDSKKHLSDIVSEALEVYVKAWISENGLPESPAERREYVRKLAARNLAKLREQLLTEQ
jgi:hypothetical protein